MFSPYVPTQNVRSTQHAARRSVTQRLSRQRDEALLRKKHGFLSGLKTRWSLCLSNALCCFRSCARHSAEASN